MILPNGAMVAVLNGEALQLFHNRGHEPSIDLVALPLPEIGEEKAGSGGRHRSSTANPDDKRLAEDDFAAACGALLSKAVLDGKIEKLLVIADSRTLGELRRHLHPVVHKGLLGEIAKNLVGRTGDDIKSVIEAF
jgi:protein required for attachment to host cells